MSVVMSSEGARRKETCKNIFTLRASSRDLKNNNNNNNNNMHGGSTPTIGLE